METVDAMEAPGLKKKNSKDFWDQKYREQASIQKEPSSFLLTHIGSLPAGAKALDLACGTGRNAVAMALRKMEVTAIDFSEVALEAAARFAEESHVKINWKKADLDFFIPELLSYDLISLIDFKPPQTLFNNLIRGLKKSGRLILEAPMLAAMKSNPDLEPFECFQPGELLKAIQKPGLNFRVLFYSELDGDRVQILAEKTEML